MMQIHVLAASGQISFEMMRYSFVFINKTHNSVSLPSDSALSDSSSTSDL